MGPLQCLSALYFPSVHLTSSMYQEKGLPDTSCNTLWKTQKGEGEKRVKLYRYL